MDRFLSTLRLLSSFSLPRFEFGFTYCLRLFLFLSLLYFLGDMLFRFFISFFFQVPVFIHVIIFRAHRDSTPYPIMYKDGFFAILFYPGLSFAGDIFG